MERLVKISEASRREDGSLIPLGQEIAEAAEYITNMRQYVSELEQRERDARAKALEEAAKTAEAMPLLRPVSTSHVKTTSPKDVAAAIRTLKDEVR